MGRDIAVVTGASGGIGGAIARMIHERGRGELRLALHCNKNLRAVQSLKSEIPDSFVVQADLSHASGREALVQAAVDQGTPYILVNAAGLGKPYELALDLTENSFDMLLAANLKAPLFLMKQFGREMVRSGSGVIVNISSVLAHKSMPGSGAYRATKAALEELTKQFAMELGPRGVRVNAVAPGFIQTAMTEDIPDELRQRITQQISLGKIGTPAAVAEAVCHLIENDYINGAILAIDGGLGI